MTIYQPTIALKQFTNMNGVVYEDTYLDANQNIAFISGVDSVSQTVSNAISLWKKDYQFDVTLGTPWDNILGQISNRLLLTSYIQSAVLNVSYVKSIISIDFVADNKNRKLGVVVKYNTVDKIVSIANANI